MRRLVLAGLVCGVCLTGCGRDAVRSAWEQRVLAADRAYDQGALDRASSEYAALVQGAKYPRDHRYLAFQSASILERQGRLRQALRAYEALWRSGEEDEYAARAVYRAGRVLLDGYGDEVRALAVMERLVLSRPDRAVADRALIDMLAVLDRRGEKRAALLLLDRLYQGVGHTSMGDNIMYLMAQRLVERGDPARAERAFGHVVAHHGLTGLADNARWHLGGLRWQAGDLKAALVHLKLLAEDRDASWQVGLYESDLADDARFWRGVLLYRAGRFAMAADEFARLLVDFPDSILRDDARLNGAVALGAQGDAAGSVRACRELARVEPASRWVDRCEARVASGALGLSGAVPFGEERAGVSAAP